MNLGAGGTRLLSETKGDDSMVDMDIIDVREDSIMIVETRTIRIGQTIRINPSEAYLGIESGLIKVLGFIPPKPDNETAYIAGEDTESILSDIEYFKEIELQAVEGTEDYAGRLGDLDNQQWVVYRYNGNHIEYQVLPLDLFVGHTMYY